VSGNPNEANHWDWLYRYNAMGEREQKRLYHAPLADSIVGQPYPWVHYLLGGSKDQLAVWHGQQMTSPFCDTVSRRNVFLYPTEYLTYGVGHQSSLLTRPDGTKEYRLFDHLGSSRAVIGTSGATYSDYAPFGGLLGGGTESRKGFIDREKDGESGLRNFGVRQYDDEAGRFLSIDPKSHLLPSWSPYAFALNNPILFIDPDGQFPYTFHVRSFHPDRTFGGGFMGDNRGFSNNPSSSSRIAQRFTFDPSTGQTSNKGFANNFSMHVIGLFATKGMWGLGKDAPTETHYNVSGGNRSYKISTGYEGSNPLTPGFITPDIDVRSNFSITENLEKGILSIGVSIKGDDFPSTESFLTDQAGNSVFVGISSLSGGVLTSLWGDNYRDIIDANISISIDNNGTFTGVTVGDRKFTLGEWNKQFETQSTK